MMKLCERFDEMYRYPVESRHLQDMIDFMDRMEIRHKECENYHLPDFGRFWIVEIYSRERIFPLIQLVDSELDRLRKEFKAKEKDHGKK